MEPKLDPVLMGAIEKKIVEGILRLQEAYNIINYLKEKHGFEIIPLERLAPKEQPMPTIESHIDKACLE